MLNKNIDNSRDVQIIAHPLGEDFGAALVIIDKHGAGTWKHITREDAARLAKELEAYALGE